MQDPSDVLEPALEQAQRMLKEMKKTHDLQERLTQSRILLNLCRSAGVFFDLMSNAMASDGFPGFPDEDDE